MPSLWLFHEIIDLDRTRWLELVDKYWVQTGADPKWIESVKGRTTGMNAWESGEQLLAEGANIIQHPLADDVRRVGMLLGMSECSRCRLEPPLEPV